MMVFYNGDGGTNDPFFIQHNAVVHYLYGPEYPSACEWIVPGTYEAFE